MRIAVLTYSRHLRNETLRRLGIYSNCKVYTFHQMAGILSGSTVENDASLLQFIRDTSGINQLPHGNLLPFDIVVLDEFQDCTELLYRLTCRFIQAISQIEGAHPPRLVVLGDERQSIFRFRGADSRFLTRAHMLFSSIVPYSWDTIHLDQSFRLSKQTVRFINEAFLQGQTYITSAKDGPRPKVLQCNPFKTSDLVDKLFPLIKSYGVANSAILAPSTRNNVPLIRLTNRLSQRYHVPIFVPTADEAALDEKVTHGKMCVSTIHQFKGSERDLTIVFGMDGSFFKYFGRNLPCDQCPNEVLVALTRASKQLVLVQDVNQGQMPFVSEEALPETADVEKLSIKKRDVAVPVATAKDIPYEIGVSDIVRHMRDDVLYDIATHHLCIQNISQPTTMINLPDIVSSNRKMNYYEPVTDLNGLVVVAASELELNRSLKTLGQDQDSELYLSPASSPEYVADIYQRACKYEARLSGYLPRSIQLKNSTFNRIAPEKLNLARRRLTEQLEKLRDPATVFQFEFKAPQTLFDIDGERVSLNGMVDVVGVPPDLDQNGNKDVQFLAEIKFVSKLSYQHVVQAATYAYMLTKVSGEVPRTILYNVRDGSKWVILARKGRESLCRIIEEVLRRKMMDEREREIDDDKFMRMCEEARQEVLGLGGSQSALDQSP